MLLENRHRAGWRFSRFFIIIVTVKEPICKVIRMVSPPFRVVWPTACRLCSVPQNDCTISRTKVKPSRPGGLDSYSAWDTQAAVGAAVRVERRLVRRTGPRSSELLQDAAGLSVRHVHQLQHALVGRAVIRPVRHKGYLRLSLFHVLTSSPFAPPDRRGAHIRATETKKFKNR